MWRYYKNRFARRACFALCINKWDGSGGDRSKDIVLSARNRSVVCKFVTDFVNPQTPPVEFRHLVIARTVNAYFPQV